MNNEQRPTRRPGRPVSSSTVLTRTSVIAAAVTIADSHGFSAVTLPRLAGSLNVRTPSLYSHITGITDVQNALALAGLRDLVGAIRLATVGISSDSAITAAAHAYRVAARTHPGLYVALSRTKDTALPELTVLAQELIELIAALIAPYGLRPEATIHAIRVLRSSLHGFVTIEHLDGFNLPYDIDESFRCLIDVQLAGLKYWHYAVRS